MTETADEIVDRVLSRQARTTPTNGSTPDDHNRSSGGTWCQGLFNAEALRTEEFPPLTWIVPDILPAEGVALLCSKPKLGKSWCVLDLCLGCTMNRLILGTQKRDACDLFALGVSFGFMASIFAYLSQYQNLRIMKEGGDMPIGVRWERTAGIVSVNLGLVVFLIATVVAIVGFLTGQPGPAPLT